jgi:hypothetical protein
MEGQGVSSYLWCQKGQQKLALEVGIRGVYTEFGCCHNDILQKWNSSYLYCQQGHHKLWKEGGVVTLVVLVLPKGATETGTGVGNKGHITQRGGVVQMIYLKSETLYILHFTSIRGITNYGRRGFHSIDFIG